MEPDKIYDILQSCKDKNPHEIIKELNKEEGLVKGIIGNLSGHYKKQGNHPIYSTLFELYRSNDKEARCFVLQFVPVLIWIYLSAMSRRDKQGYGKLEAILLAIYNTEVQENGHQCNPKTFRLPSLSRPSVYHESSFDVTSQSALTESALSRHELTETPVPGPKKQLNRITAAHRMSVLCVTLNKFNNNISLMDKESHASYCLTALRIAIAGFSELCTPETRTSNITHDVLSNEEFSRLAIHPRIPLSADFIQQLIQGLDFLMYNGYRVEAAKAVDNLHFRAVHSLLAPAHLLSSAVRHSLIPTGGLPHNGPLGLHVQLRGTQAVPASPDRPTHLKALDTDGMTSRRQILQDDVPDDVIPSNDDTSTQTGSWIIKPHVTKSDLEMHSFTKQETDEVQKACASEENISQDESVCSTKL